VLGRRSGDYTLANGSGKVARMPPNHQTSPCAGCGTKLTFGATRRDLSERATTVFTVDCPVCERVAPVEVPRDIVVGTLRLVGYIRPPRATR